MLKVPVGGDVLTDVHDIRRGHPQVRTDLDNLVALSLQLPTAPAAFVVLQQIPPRPVPVQIVSFAALKAFP